jgi:hypothetical protein
MLSYRDLLRIRAIRGELHMISLDEMHGHSS